MRHTGVTVLIALLVSGCGPFPQPVAPPQLCHAQAADTLRAKPPTP